MTERVDVAVIGLGPGGEEVAGRLAEAGLSVVGFDSGLVGGECPYWGCIPSKTMIRASNALEESRRVRGLAGEATVSPSWDPVAARIREMTDSWDDRVAVERFEGKGGRFVRGRARLDGPGRVVGPDGTLFECARGVVIATGSTAVIPPIDGIHDVDPWTNRQLVETEALPASIAVLGGGAVGLELAQSVSRFGVRVAVVESADRLVAAEEPEASAEIEHVLRDGGIEVHTSAAVDRVSGAPGSVTLHAGERRIEVERLLVATGRRSNMAGIGLETVGLDPSAKAIDVDGDCRAAPGVWSVGDCTGRGAFTHVAIHQGRIAAADILGEPHAQADYSALPRVTFTDPEIGAAGLTEKQARDRGLLVRTATASVPSSARGWIHGPGNTGVIKLVADADRAVLVGATSMGPWGGEVLSMLALAVHAGVTVQRLREMIYAYPTFHRGVEDALRDLKLS